MKIAVRYQSRGGNTKAVAEVIANSLGVKAEAVDNAITQWVDELEITIGELMHSKLKDNADFLTEKVDEAISNAIDITISNRKLERKTTILQSSSFCYGIGIWYCDGFKPECYNTHIATHNE